MLCVVRWCGLADAHVHEPRAIWWRSHVLRVQFSGVLNASVLIRWRFPVSRSCLRVMGTHKCYLIFEMGCSSRLFCDFTRSHGGYCHWHRRGHCRCCGGYSLLLQEAPCSRVTWRNICDRFDSHEHDQGPGCVNGNRSIFSWRSFASRSSWPSAPLCAATAYRARALAAKVGRDAQPGLLVGRGLGHEHVGAAGGCCVKLRPSSSLVLVAELSV